MAGDRPTSSFSPIPVGVWNDLVTMRNEWKATGAVGGKGKADPYANPTDIIKVGNDTADALVKGKVLEISTKICSAIDDCYPAWAVGVKPTAGNVQIAVLLRPCLAKSGSKRQIVWAQVSGTCFVKVNVGAIWHRRARPVKDAYVLTSGLFGPAEILVAPTTTGEQMCLCRVGHSDNRGVFAKTTSSITAAVLTSGRLTLGSGTATLQDPYATTATQYEESSHSLTVYNMAGDAVATAGFVQLVPTDDWLPLVNIDPCTQPT